MRVRQKASAVARNCVLVVGGMLLVCRALIQRRRVARAAFGLGSTVARRSVTSEFYCGSVVRCTLEWRLNDFLDGRENCAENRGMGCISAMTLSQQRRLFGWSVLRRNGLVRLAGIMTGIVRLAMRICGNSLASRNASTGLVNDVSMAGRESEVCPF